MKKEVKIGLLVAGLILAGGLAYWVMGAPQSRLGGRGTRTPSAPSTGGTGAGTGSGSGGGTSSGGGRRPGGGKPGTGGKGRKGGKGKPDRKPSERPNDNRYAPGEYGNGGGYGAYGAGGGGYVGGGGGGYSGGGGVGIGYSSGGGGGYFGGGGGSNYGGSGDRDSLWFKYDYETRSGGRER